MINMSTTPAKRIVHLTSVHLPFDVRIFHKECKTLARVGYEVVLIAPYKQDETVDGVRIRAVPEPRNKWDRIAHTIWQMYRAACCEDAKICHFHDPELILIGLLLKLRGKSVVYDVHEDVPQQIFSKQWIPPFLRPLVSRAVYALETFAAQRFDGIAAATNTIAGRFEKMNSRTITLHNWPLGREFEEFLVTPFSTDRKVIRVGYFGSIAEDRGAIVMLDATLRLNRRIPAALVLAGPFSSKECRKNLENHPGWKYVEYLGVLNREQVLEQLARLDIGIDVPAPLPRRMVALPTKVFEFMAAGLPFVAANFPIVSSVIDEHHCGIEVDPTNSQEVVDAILWLAQHQSEARSMGVKGREAALAKFRWEQETKKLTLLYEDILQGG